MNARDGRDRPDVPGANPADMAGESAAALDPETIEYLASIADITAEMRPFEELMAEATGCPDPDFYAGDEDWEC